MSIADILANQEIYERPAYFASEIVQPHKLWNLESLALVRYNRIANLKDMLDVYCERKQG